MSSTEEVHVGLAVQASSPPTFTPAASTKPNVLVEQMESVEIFMETDEIILLSPEDVRGMAAIPVEGSVLVGPIESVAVVTESEPSAVAGQDELHG